MDAMTKDYLRGGEPFLLQGGREGVLLVHGFTGFPRDMRPLGEHLNQQGLTALGVRLAGHGTHVDDLTRTHWRDWYRSVLDGYGLLRGLCSKVWVMGLSMGGDTFIPGENANYLHIRPRHTARRLVWLERSEHVITVDVEQAELFAGIDQFMAEIKPVRRRPSKAKTG